MKSTSYNSRLALQKHIATACLIGLAAVSFSDDSTDDAIRDFGFKPLEIHKFKMGTTRLIVSDINNDGLDDILFANNHVSRLEILIRKPEGEESEDLPKLEDKFESKGIIVDQSLKAIRVADLNGDDRPDIVTFGTAIGLQIRYQQEDGSFASPERLFIKNNTTVTTIQLGDLNGDGMKDILVCRRDSADMLLYNEDAPFKEKKTLTFSGDKSFYGDIADVNDDGIADLAFHFNTTRNPLKIRFGKGGGLYGIEQPIDLPLRQYMDILQTDGESPQIGMVLRNRLGFRLYDFIQKEQPALMEAQEIAPGRIGLEGTNKKSPAAWITGDFNNDGYDDLLIAAPELSRLHLYNGTEDGLTPEPVRIDTLSDITRMSRMKNGDVLVLSKKEKIAALHKAYDLEKFPTILQMPGTILAACAVEADNLSWFVCKDDEKNLQLVKMGVSDEDISTYPLDMQNDPNDLLAFQLPDGKFGLIFFMSYDTPKMQIFDGETLTEVTSESFRALTQKLALNNIRFVKPGDGSSIIISQGAIARRFEWKDGRYDVTKQFNPETPRGEMIASTPFKLTDGSEGTLFYDRNAGDLIRFSDEGNDWGKIQIPDADQTIFNLIQLKHPSRDVIVLLDSTGLNLVMGNGKRLAVESCAEYISPAENVLLAYAKLIKLGEPVKTKIVLVDPANRAVEIVSRKGDQLEKELIFEIFLTSDFAEQSRGTEPHDVESGDLNGDGIGDLVVLVHDKLLIYLGE